MSTTPTPASGTRRSVKNKVRVRPVGAAKYEGETWRESRTWAVKPSAYVVSAPGLTASKLKQRMEIDEKQAGIIAANIITTYLETKGSFEAAENHLKAFLGLSPKNSKKAGRKL